ncbi:MAG: nitroreductase family deazaflavin-dependent oxidoreductase [Promicromonosporaceae bacterium]|nr:nitroreductase family deazaflavin-dependent oxidoreductase [Promicromonosporaceae bacterium]
MTFDTPRGTRGRRPQSAGPLQRFGNGRIVARIRKKGGRGFMGMNTLVLTTVGARTGKERQTPLAWFPADGGGWLVVAAAAGAATNPAWYHNLAAHPDRVTIELDGTHHDVVAEQLHGDERATAWAQVVAAVPRFGGYEKTTDRVMPVIRLRER